MTPVERLRRLFSEALEYLRRGDVVQSSEKLYKIAEDVVKVFAEIHELESYREARQRGRWTTELLDEAAKELVRIYGEEVYSWWDAAYRLHVEGFHEERLSAEDVEGRAAAIYELLVLLERALRDRRF